MTTVVYCHKDEQVAVDSRVTMGHKVCTDDMDKTWVTDDYVFWLAGSLADIETVIEMYPTYYADEAPECSGFVFHRHEGVLKSISWSPEREYQSTISWNEAVGSGQDHAITALDLGCTAEQAVKMAAKRDASTGGVIKVHDLADYLLFDKKEEPETIDILDLLQQ